MKIIKTNKAPKAIGTYSQGVISNGFVYTSGQIGIDPSSGVLQNQNIESEIKQIIKNIESILIAGGSSLENIVKMNIFLTDISHFALLNNILHDFLNLDKLPSRSTVEISRLPKDAKIEIDVIGEILS